MTTDKAGKRAVRTRMARTGERYAAARRHVPATPPPAADAPGEGALPPRRADPLVSDATVRSGTGRGWDDWFRLLDAKGATAMTHRDIARLLVAEHEISGWWSQNVTVGYERARGLRAVHQTSRGFEVSVSKTIAASAADIWRSFDRPAIRSRWLEPRILRARPAKGERGRSARYDVLPDGTRLVVTLDPRGEGRTAVTLTNERLAGPDAIAGARSAWKGRIERLATYWAARAVASSGRRSS